MIPGPTSGRSGVGCWRGRPAGIRVADWLEPPVAAKERCQPFFRHELERQDDGNDHGEDEDAQHPAGGCGTGSVLPADLLRAAPDNGHTLVYRATAIPQVTARNPVPCCGADLPIPCG